MSPLSKYPAVHAAPQRGSEPCGGKKTDGYKYGDSVACQEEAAPPLLAGVERSKKGGAEREKGKETEVGGWRKTKGL